MSPTAILRNHDRCARHDAMSELRGRPNLIICHARTVSMISGSELQTFRRTSNVRLEVATPSSRLLFSQAASMMFKECHLSWICIGPQLVRNPHPWAINKLLTRAGVSRIPEDCIIFAQWYAGDVSGCCIVVQL